MYVYVCMWVCEYESKYVTVTIKLNGWFTYMYVCMHIRKYACNHYNKIVNGYMGSFMYVCMYVCMWTYLMDSFLAETIFRTLGLLLTRKVRLHLRTCMYVIIYVCMHTCTCILNVQLPRISCEWTKSNFLIGGQPIFARITFWEHDNSWFICVVIYVCMYVCIYIYVLYTSMSGGPSGFWVRLLLDSLINYLCTVCIYCMYHMYACMEVSK